MTCGDDRRSTCEALRLALLPCPFCGKRDELHVHAMGNQPGQAWDAAVYCDGCGVEGPGASGIGADGSKLAALEAWNRRATPSAPPLGGEPPPCRHGDPDERPCDGCMFKNQPAAPPRPVKSEPSACPEWCAKGKCEAKGEHEIHFARKGDYTWRAPTPTPPPSAVPEAKGTR